MDMFQPECWRTLPGRQPPKPPPQCFVCRPDQAVTLQLPALSAGALLGVPTCNKMRPEFSYTATRPAHACGRDLHMSDDAAPPAEPTPQQGMCACVKTLLAADQTSHTKPDTVPAVHRI